MKKIFRVCIAAALLACMLSVTALAAGEGTISLEGPPAAVAVGDEFQVILSVEAEDIAAMQYSLTFDEAFRIVNTEIVSGMPGSLPYHVAKGIWANIEGFSWDVQEEDLSSLCNTDLSGQLIVFTFKSVSEVKDGDISVWAMGCDVEENVIEFEDTSVKVTVSDPSGKLLGDVNGDGVVKQSDSTFLLRYLSGSANTIDMDTADINGDGKLTQTDYSYLVRYLAGWTVQYAIGQPISG